MAESVRFELTEPFGSTVFKTVAIDHSANSPHFKIGTGGGIRTPADAVLETAALPLSYTYIWRSDWDSNPGYPFRYYGLAIRCITALPPDLWLHLLGSNQRPND